MTRKLLLAAAVALIPLTSVGVGAAKADGWGHHDGFHGYSNPWYRHHQHWHHHDYWHRYGWAPVYRYAPRCYTTIYGTVACY